MLTAHVVVAYQEERIEYMKILSISVEYSNLLFFSNSCRYYCRVADPSLDNYDKQALPVVCRLSSAAVCVLLASAAAAVSHSKIFDV